MKTDTPEGIWASVNTCAEHPPGSPVDRDCGACKAEHDQRWDVIQELTTDVQVRVSGLEAMGVRIPQEAFLAVRLNMLAEYILQDPRSRGLFEGEYMRQVTEQLKEAQSAAKEPILSTPPDRKLTVVRNHKGRG